MKVLYLANIPSPYRIAFFDAMAKDCDLTVLFERKTAADRNAGWLSKRSDAYKTVFLNGLKIGNENALSLGVTKYLKKKDYDLFVVGGYATPTAMLAIAVMRLKGIPYILNADGGYIKPNKGLKLKMKQFFIGGAHAWLCSGEPTKDYLVHYGANPDRTYIYPFTSLLKSDILKTPPSAPKKQAARDMLDIQESKVVLAVGQFIRRKGFDILLQSWADMPEDYGLYLIGDQPKDEYLALERVLRLENVHYVSFSDKETIKQYYTAADLFVLPTREDIWGLVIGEAMAFGLPVITTTACIAGLTLIDETCGRLIVPEHVAELHSAIIDVISDDKKRRAMGRAGLNRIQSYTIENMAKRHVELFNRLLES